jgi:hypothetical protein
MSFGYGACQYYRNQVVLHNVKVPKSPPTDMHKSIRPNFSNVIQKHQSAREKAAKA